MNARGSIFHFTISVLTLSVLAACGGGDDVAAVPDTSKPAVNTLTGLAATGAALAGAAVSAKCASGPDLSGNTATDGSFTLNLAAGQSTPCMLKVTGGSPAVTLYSYAAAAGRVNLTPFTDLALANATANGAASAYSGFNAASGSALGAKLAESQTYVKNQMTALFSSAPAADVFTGAFKVGDADDKLLDALSLALKTANKSLADFDAAAGSSGDLKALVLAAGGGGNTGGGGTGGTAGSGIGTGAYSAVKAADSAAFLAYLPKACAVTTVYPDYTMYSKCLQDNTKPANNLTAQMWFGALPHVTGGPIVSGPDAATSKVSFVGTPIADVAVGDACKVAIAEPFIPIAMTEVRGAAWSGAVGAAFSFYGSVDDTISVNKSGLVFEYTMTSKNGKLKLEMHPNLSLFDASLSGSEGNVEVLSAPGQISGYFICK